MDLKKEAGPHHLPPPPGMSSLRIQGTPADGLERGKMAGGGAAMSGSPTQMLLLGLGDWEKQWGRGGD